MHIRLTICFLLLSVLGACADTGCIASLSASSTRGAACALAPLPASEAAPAARTVERAAARTAGTTYTAIAGQPAKTDVIPVRIDASFNDAERSKIVRALEEWNHVLNGHIRLDVSVLPFGVGAEPPYGVTDQRTWFIGRVAGKSKNTSRPQFGQGIAQQQTLANGGELVLVFTDRVGKADLGGVMLHEIGHALGLGHEEHARHDDANLMSAQYASRKQTCVDRGAVRSLATARGLPFEDLNWCGDTASVAAANLAGAGRGERTANQFLAQAR